MLPSDKTINYGQLREFRVWISLLFSCSSSQLHPKTFEVLFSLSFSLYTQKNGGLIGTDVDKAREALLKVQGSVVEMPLCFLEKEDLLPDFGTLENFAPDRLVT